MYLHHVCGLLVLTVQFEGYEVTMVNGKIAFQMGSTVPTLERAELVLARKEEEAVESKPEIEAAPQPVGAIANGEAPASETAEGPQAQPAAVDTEVEVDVKPDISQDGPAPEEAEGAAPLELVETAPSPTPPPPPRTIANRTARQPLPLPASLFIGDLRLTVLRSRLQALTPPVPAEFAGSGILICGPGVLALANQSEKGAEVKAGSIVAVRKGDRGVEIEGSVGSVYDQVRKEVYGSFAQVSAA